MNAAHRLGEPERQRLLQTMGFDVWVRRGSEPLAPVPVPGADARVAAEPPRRAPREAPPRDGVRELAQADARPAEPVRAPVAARRAAQSVLLILEKRVHADEPIVRQLMRSLPGCLVCTPDTIARGAARFALQLGVDAVLPADVLGVRAPALDALRQSASARRGLWWSLKPMLKALKG
jgi:DNA polymerase III psi subunit